jgi:hypothetical protein
VIGLLPRVLYNLQMPPTFGAKDELSLRHLPNISNTSFSFQIPTSLSKGDLLLGDDGSDFFHNTEDNITTPGSSSMPLTLAELTPAVNAAQCYSTVLPAQPDPSPKQTPQDIAKVSAGLPPSSQLYTRPVTRSRAGEASPAVARLRALKAEVETLNEDLQSETDDVTSQLTFTEEPQPPTSSKLPKAITKQKRVRSQGTHSRELPDLNKIQTPIFGRITKSRSKKTSTKSNFTRCLPSVPQFLPNPQTREPTHKSPNGVACGEQNPDDGMYPTTTSGAAERLVNYSQKFMNSFGCVVFGCHCEYMLITTRNLVSRAISSEPVHKPVSVPDPIFVDPANSSSSRNKPFTLSQLPSHKPASSRPSSPAITVPVSPMRLPSKRPATDASSYQVSKKGKTTVAAPSNDAKGLPTQEDAVRKVLPGIDSSSSLKGVHVPVTTRTGVPTRRLAKATTTAALRSIPSKTFVPCAPDLNGAASFCSNSLQRSQVDDDPLAEISDTRQSGETSSGVACLKTTTSQRDRTRVSSVTLTSSKLNCMLMLA